MKKNVFVGMAVTFMLVLLMSSCHFKVVKGDGNIVTETLPAGDFDQIEVEGSNLVLNYTQSAATPSAEVTTDKNIYDMYRFEVENNTLKIKPKEENRNFHFAPTQFVVTAHSSKLENLSISGDIDVKVDSPLISENLKISMAGSCEINLNDSVHVQDFSISMAGSGALNAPKLACKEFNSKLAGSGELNISGVGETISCEIAGSGTLNALDFVVDEVHSNIAGSGDINVHANKLIQAKVAGSGNISYKGNPEIRNEGISIGSVKKLD